jgi:hypothetical protein
MGDYATSCYSNPPGRPVTFGSPQLIHLVTEANSDVSGLDAQANASAGFGEIRVFDSDGNPLPGANWMLEEVAGRYRNPPRCSPPVCCSLDCLFCVP